MKKVINIAICFVLVGCMVPIGIQDGEMKVNKAQALPNSTGKEFDFLEEIARAAGLTTGTSVATVSGVLGAGLGFVASKGLSIDIDGNGVNNLAALVDAADYPDWDTLTTEEKEIWDNDRTEYDAQKFNSLMAAFGLESAHQRYITADNFEWTNEEQTILQKLKNVGDNWVNRAGNSITNINELLTSDATNVVAQYQGLNTNVINGTDIVDWPDDLPDYVYTTLTNRVTIEYSNTKYIYATNIEVYAIVNRGSSNFGIILFSKYPFKYGYSSRSNGYWPSEPNLNSDGAERIKNENVFYSAWSTTGTGGASEIRTNAPLNYLTNDQMNSLYSNIGLVFGQSSVTEQYEPDLPGYPDDVSQEPNQIVYYPVQGINDDTTWEDFTSEPEKDDHETAPTPEVNDDLAGIVELLKQFKFYVTGQLKVHDEGLHEVLGDIYFEVSNIRGILERWFQIDTAPDVIGEFDFPELQTRSEGLLDTISSLAPFGALNLLSEMVAILSTTGNLADPEMEFDFDFFPGHEYKLNLDLSWMDDAKPVFNFACITTLVLGLLGSTIRIIEMEATG